MKKKLKPAVFKETGHRVASNYTVMRGLCHIYTCDEIRRKSYHLRHGIPKHCTLSRGISPELEFYRALFPEFLISSAPVLLYPDTTNVWAGHYDNRLTRRHHRRLLEVRLMCLALAHTLAKESNRGRLKL